MVDLNELQLKTNKAKFFRNPTNRGMNPRSKSASGRNNPSIRPVP